MSQEYIGAIVLVIVGVLKIFGIIVSADTITGIIVGGTALWIAIRRKQRGDIDILGRRIY